MREAECESGAESGGSFCFASPQVVCADLRMLRCYLAVAEELHFGRAAARLGIGQSSVSRTVRALERQLGTRLLVRKGSPRPVQITEAGQILLAEGRDLMTRYEAIANNVRAANGTPPY